ncbi:MAG TPA: ChaN family lipoprotein [Hydrogenophaga sp.]|uniref:ChaN family lipoprotein n=1 Tax=Hydrogenophaga sp. TaxID=1904254 RepID=UPI002C43237F|nr:ChaN family lipoprotein [Hydrogenophaga sp.]HMN92148.1 ChaN family lipoprotein [Hydrogenophaga sp.]HMP11850.1 ChaN family lipoprotein [Hydrogenophaga sp.]
MIRSCAWTALLLSATLWAGGCSSGAAVAVAGESSGAPLARSPSLDALPQRPLWLLGEQHDAPAHQSLQVEVVGTLAGQGRLAAVVVEMVEAGRGTAGLEPGAAETRVRAALDWTDERNLSGWPWSSYGPMIMAAVRAGVPVLGGNLPRSRQREAMADTALDRLLDAEQLARQQALVRDGHCGLLPEAQIAPMTRIQLARDRSLAAVAAGAVQTGRTVLLVAGNEHVRRDLGVPRHLPADLQVLVLQARSRPASTADATAFTGPGLQADHTWLTPPLPERDYCAELRQRFGR